MRKILSKYTEMQQTVIRMLLILAWWTVEKRLPLETLYQLHTVVTTLQESSNWVLYSLKTGRLKF